MSKSIFRRLQSQMSEDEQPSFLASTFSLDVLRKALSLKVRETYKDEPDTIEDGFGNVWSSVCTQCGGSLEVVRPGKVQCPECE